MSNLVKNRTEIVEQLTEILIDFDKSLSQYQTDVYLYYDEGTKTAKLDTYPDCSYPDNVDDDNVYIIYSDHQHYENWSGYYCNKGDFAWGLDMSNEDFDSEVCEYLKQQGYEVEEGYEPEWYEKRDYIESREDYSDKLFEVYVANLEEQRAEYAEQAEQIISEWENNAEKSMKTTTRLGKLIEAIEEYGDDFSYYNEERLSYKKAKLI